jgi:hypothetical protein
MPTIMQRRQPKCKIAYKYNCLKQMRVWAVISIININSIIKTHLQRHKCHGASSHIGSPDHFMPKTRALGPSALQVKCNHSPKF